MQGREPLYGLFRNVVALTHFILLKMESNAKCKYETLCHWIEPFTFSIDNAAAVGSKSSWFCLGSMQQTIFFCIFMFMTTDRIKKRDIRIFTKRRGGVNSNDYFASWPMNAGEIERWEWNICFENISAGGHRLFWYTHIAHLHPPMYLHTLTYSLPSKNSWISSENEINLSFTLNDRSKRLHPLPASQGELVVCRKRQLAWEYGSSSV